MTSHPDIRPIDGGALPASRFGQTAARLSALAEAGVPVVAGLALGADVVNAFAAAPGNAPMKALAPAVASLLQGGDPLTLIATPQDGRWGGPPPLAGLGGPLDEAFRQDFAAATGAAPPERPEAQIARALGAAAEAWNSPTARILRTANGAPADAGLGAVLLCQVPGLVAVAQGIDEISGRPSLQLDTSASVSAECRQKITDIIAVATRVLKDAASVSLVLAGDDVLVRDMRPARRAGRAEIQVVVDLVDAGVLSRQAALLRVDPRSLIEHIHPQIAPDAPRDVLGQGIAASPGAAQGPIVFSATAAQAAEAKGVRAILVRTETSPEDIRGMNTAAAVLTLTGGLTSHAAVIAQGLGVPCVVGASELRIDAQSRTLAAPDGRVLQEGDVVTLDGSTGIVLNGKLALQHSALSDAFRTLLAWADDTRAIGVRANADTLQEARSARRFQVDGIGLCRTEHMFYEPERLIVMRELILADNADTRAAALERLLPMQRSDFAKLFELMEDAPVTIRLLDPPLHEFLPKEASGLTALADAMGLAQDVVADRISALEEFNPMLGKRGVRLAVTFPEIYEMQARAIFEAAVAAEAVTGVRVSPEIMIPLVSANREVELVTERVDAVARAVRAETGAPVPYALGVMVETPRAALRAGDLAHSSRFLSFGTNDLTQMTYGLSRDDAGRFMREYVAARVFAEDPFLTLDVEGVGELLLTAAKRGRAANPDLVLGLCGEHGGDPASVHFCKLAGFDYVSCSPFRVPIARLAAAQATLLIAAEKAG